MMLVQGILLFLAVGRNAASNANSECDDETCPGAPTKTNSMLQFSRGGTKKAKVPLVNPDKRFMAQGPASLLTLEGEQEFEWVAVQKSGSEHHTAELTKLCDEPGVKCTTTGHSASDGGAGMLGLRCNEHHLERVRRKFFAVLAYVEPDAADETIPELEGHGLDTLAVRGDIWGLQRIGGENVESDYWKGGDGVHVYVTDTGIRTSHQEFGGRAINTLEVLGDTVTECNGDTSCAGDVQGHGTHCAGTIGGVSVGVARQATLHAVKTLSDTGGGQFGWWIAAIDWVSTKGTRPAVVSASLGGSGSSDFVRDGLTNVVNNGVTVVVAAGNSQSDTCNFQPAFVPAAVTVGSTTNSNARSGFSNYGSCLDIYAPGSGIVSADAGGDNGEKSLSGTSMACPHVAGAVALFLAADGNLNPTQIVAQLKDQSLKDGLSNLRTDCPNELLYVPASLPPTPPPTPGPPTPAPTPAPTPVPPETCEGGPGCLKIDLVTDNYPGETKWHVVERLHGAVEMSGGPYQSKNEKFSYSQKLDPTLSYKVVITDDYGDGLCCSYGQGEFVVHYEDHEVMRVDEFGSTVDEVFGNSNMLKIEIQFKTDKYPQESKVEIHDLCEGAMIFDQAFSSKEADHNLELEVPPTRAFEVVIKDSYGDGICCGYGDGAYKVFYDGELVGSGGKFYDEERHQFGSCDPSEVPAPPPNDTNDTLNQTASPFAPV